MAFPYYPMFQPFQPYQPYQPQQSFSPAQAGIIWVSGEKEAQMYPVAPNNAVTLWSQSEPVVYVKQTDATGKPSLKVYDLIERETSTQEQSTEYAKKSDISEIVGVVKGFSGIIDSLKADLDSMKADMYGIAGKQKKKVEVKEDE